mmetsp:Transcript_16854/g.48025  ORF Transcript_16854/g.48025 Transcript_16854/m.48025 type:complete len:90 (+) Transcript_16854:414-683(+)
MLEKVIWMDVALALPLSMATMTDLIDHYAYRMLSAMTTMFCYDGSHVDAHSHISMRGGAAALSAPFQTRHGCMVPKNGAPFLHCLPQHD